MYEAHLLSAEVPQVQWSIAEWRLGPSFWDAPPEFVRKEWIAHIFITEHSQNSEKFRHDWTLWQDNYGSVSASRLRWSHKCRLFFSPSTQIQSFERQPWRGNYRNCDRGKILSLYESPLGICCVCQSQSMFSLFDFLHQLVQPVLFCNAGIVFPPVWSQRLHSNSCLTILVPVWFQLSLACPWTMDRV